MQTFLGAETQIILFPVVIDLWGRITNTVVDGVGIEQTWVELQLCQNLIK